MALFNLVVTEIYGLAVQRQRGIPNILIDESTDERDAVVGVLLREKLVGTLCNGNQMANLRRSRVTGLLPCNIDVQCWHEERRGRGRDQIQEPLVHNQLGFAR